MHPRTSVRLYGSGQTPAPSPTDSQCKCPYHSKYILSLPDTPNAPPRAPPSPFPLISLESFSSYWSPSPLIQPSRRTKVTTPPYSDPHIGRWCRPGKLFDRIGRRAAEMAARRPVARLPRKRRIVGVTSPQRLPPDSSAIVTPPGRGPWHCTDSVVFVAWSLGGIPSPCWKIKASVSMISSNTLATGLVWTVTEQNQTLRPPSQQALHRAESADTAEYAED